MLFAGCDFADNTATIVCEHVFMGSSVRTVQIDEEGLCFQCGQNDDSTDGIKIVCLSEVMNWDGLDRVPPMTFGMVAYRELDGSWTVELQDD